MPSGSHYRSGELVPAASFPSASPRSCPAGPAGGLHSRSLLHKDSHRGEGEPFRRMTTTGGRVGLLARRPIIPPVPAPGPLSLLRPDYQDLARDHEELVPRLQAPKSRSTFSARSASTTPRPSLNSARPTLPLAPPLSPVKNKQGKRHCHFPCLSLSGILPILLKKSMTCFQMPVKSHYGSLSQQL